MAKRKTDKTGMEVRTVKVADLHLDPNNKRKHDARSLKGIADSLSAFGQVQALVVQKSRMRVIGGNGTLQAMRMLEWQTCDIVLVDCSDDQARVLSIVLNRTGELSEWDEEAGDDIDEILASLDDAEISFMLEELSRELASSRKPESGEDEDQATGPDPMELRPNEHYDYLLVLCRSTQEWHNLLDRLGIEPKPSAKRRYGCGRAVSGRKVLDILDGKLVDLRGD